MAENPMVSKIISVKSCQKQFQDEYFYHACNPTNRELMKRMLLRGSSIRDICSVSEHERCATLNIEVGQASTDKATEKTLPTSANR